MRLRLLSLCSLLALSACGVAVGAPPAQPVVASPAAATETPPAPKPLRVLKDVYGIAFKTAQGQEIPGGARAGFWLGETAPSGGTNPVYVALTHETPGPEQEYPRPEDKVNLSGAIYQQGAQGAWQLKAKQLAAGQMGAKEEPPEHAVGAASVWLNAGQARWVWAVPTVVPAMGGARFESYELIGVDAAKGKLAHLGTLKSGASNEAGCKSKETPELRTKCFSWKSVLAVVDGPSSGPWPALAVTRKGSRYDDASGRVVPVEGHVVYPFKPDSNRYEFGQQK